MPEKIIEVSRRAPQEKNPAARTAETENKVEAQPSPAVERVLETSAPAMPAPIAPEESQSLQKRRAIAVDSILSEGLDEVFLTMPPARQQEFKRVGEQTVVKISALLEKGGTKIYQIIDLIKGWLKLIPGVNRFFLEQEAKIKADKIIRIR